MIPLTAAGAPAGAAARPSGRSRARGPEVTGTPDADAAEQPPADDGAAGLISAAGLTSAASAVWPSICEDPVPGGRSIRTGPDQRPFSYGMRSARASSHHRSMTRGSPPIGPPPSPKSRL